MYNLAHSYKEYRESACCWKSGILKLFSFSMYSSPYKSDSTVHPQLLVLQVHDWW